MNTSLYVSGLTILNNATTCTSSLYVSGLTILNGNMKCSCNVGIGAMTTALSKLHILETTGTVAGANTGSIMIDHDNSGGGFVYSI